MLVQADNGGGVFDKLICQLTDVHQALGVNTHVHKGTKVGDIADNTRQNHARAEVGQFMHGGVESKLGEGLSGVTTGLLQLCHNILQGGEAHSIRNISVDIYLLALLVVGEQVFNLAAAILCHLLHKGITLWVNSTIVQWLCATLHTQEACTLLEGLGTHAGYFQQLTAGTESSVLLSVIYDVLCQDRT